MSERHQRIESLLRELAASFVVTEANPDPLITITRVSSAPDQRQATVYFTTIPETREQDALIFLGRLAGALRQHIKKHSDLKIIPHIVFAVDSGERARQHLDEVASKIENK